MSQRLSSIIIHDPVIQLNLSGGEVSAYSGAAYGVGVVNLLATTILVLLTYFTSTRENMKISEKLVIYNALVPDIISELVLVTIIAPAISHKEWTYTVFQTTWIAFMNTACIFHSPLAISFIGDLIVMSLTDPYKFHAADNIKHMSALVISSMAISACFCSLPACEKSGYVYMPDWLVPTYNLQYQYGSMFMVFSMLGLILFKQVYNVFQMFMVRRMFLENIAKVTQRAVADMDVLILFTALNTVNAFMVLPSVIGGFVVSFSPSVVLVFELLVYLCPLARVITLYFLCPHFHFGVTGRAEEYIDEFAVLAHENDTEENRMAEMMETGSDEEEDIDL